MPSRSPETYPSPAPEKTPILLLKTKSLPVDGYEEYFDAFDNGRYTPIFVPVLEHRFNKTALERITSLVSRGCFSSSPDVNEEDVYGGIIFTSQRAVEAFAAIVTSLRQGTTIVTTAGNIDDLLPSTLPLYAVGPATAKGLRSLNLACPILGEETGNGEALAAFILNHYNHLHREAQEQSQPPPSPSREKPPLLFLVGEQRRDIIPKTLHSPALTPAQRITVSETTIYETGVMQSFDADFLRAATPQLARGAPQWIVVFSPTGCRAMLEALGMLDAPRSGRVDDEAAAAAAALRERARTTTFIAAIGPTTRDYLVAEFGFAPDACAEKPSAEGVGEAIRCFSRRVISVCLARCVD